VSAPGPRHRVQDGRDHIKKIALTLLLLLYGLSALAASPQRIISTIPSVTEMLFTLGLDERIVGVTTNCNYPPEALKKEKIGGFFLNTEKIVALKPDLVVMLQSAQPREVERLKKLGLPVLAIDPNSVETVLGTLLELGKATGRERAAEKLVYQLRRRIQAVRPKKKGLDLILGRPRSMVIVGYRPLVLAGPGSFIDDLMNRVGLENLAWDSKAPYPQYSFEKLLQKDPDLLIVLQGVVNPEEIKSNRQWQLLSAVKNGNIFFIEPDIISRPGPRLVDALEQLAGFINDTKTDQKRP
jgi:iron complex transport system substrate-binding protein